MNAAEYLARRCVCGLTRGEHIHVHEHWATGEKLLRVLPATSGERRCAGYLDELELELGGCPADNPHLAPLMPPGLDVPPPRGKGPPS